MPKRQTIIYTSNDAPRTDGVRLFVYYCRYSGKHAFTTDVDIYSLPRRRTDGAYILDRAKHDLKLYTSDGGTKLLRRADGSVERQHRLNVGSLPVAYTSDPPPPAPQPQPQAGGGDGAAPASGAAAAAAAGAGPPDLVYILDRAVTSYNRDGGDRTPLPPCIRVGESGNCEVTLELEDKQQHTMIAKITQDAVRVNIMGSASHDSSQAEVLALMSKILTLRPHQLTLLRGESPRSRVLVVEMLSARAVYARLRGIPMPQRRQDAPGARKSKPWYHGL